MVKIKMSHVLAVILALTILFFAIYGIQGIAYNGNAFEGTGFKGEITKLLCVFSMILTGLTTIPLFIGAISWLCRIEFTININKLKQILNKLK
tara:strand:- start:12 stop:290 length:279 start_codon:yes stop_codon:yes gene_type:complete